MISLNRWIVLFFGIALNFSLLIIISEENYVFKSISITIISVLSISYYIYKRYSKNLTLQSDLLISISSLVQFLFPVFYLVVFYQENPEFDYHDYRYVYAITSFAVLLGQTMFFLGYESTRKSIYFPRIKISEESYGRLFIVLFPLLTLIWLGRFVLLSTGSYYHILRSDYQFTSPFFSVFAQLNGYGLIIPGALFLIAFSEKRKRQKKTKLAIATAVFALEMLWYIPAGSRESIVLTILTVIFAYIFIMRTVPKKIIAILIIASFPLLAVFGQYRYVASETYQQSKIDLEATLPALLEARNQLIISNTPIVVSVTDRLYEGKSLGYLLGHYSNDYDFELGKTYENIPFAFIPRFLYPDKPIFTTALNNWYTLLANGSMPTTFLGEAYINFSWFGIIIIPFLLGLAMKNYDYIFIKRAAKPYWMYLYVFSAVHIIRLPLQVAVIWISFLIKIIILAFILTKLHSVITNALSNSRGSVTTYNKKL